MNVTTMSPREATLQGSRAPSQHSAQSVASRTSSKELWEKSGLGAIGTTRVARGLGWFSIGLGVAELLAPRFVARLCGGEGKHTTLIRLYGLREIASGLMIFSEGRRPAKGVWSRVAGDTIDLATLAVAAASPGTRKAGVLFGTANVLGVAAVDVLCAQALSREKGELTEGGAIRTKRSVVINRSPEQVYRFWRTIENLPQFMYHLESVQPLDEHRSHWVAKGPAGKRIEWDAEITVDRPHELIAWRSLPGSTVSNAGSVEFERRPGDRGTVVRVTIEYDPPGGIAGNAFAKLFNRSPIQQIYDDLHRLKQVLETGEVVRSDGSPEGMGQVVQRPAQPLAS